MKRVLWEIVRSKFVVNDEWLQLRADDCLTPDGKSISPYYVLEYPPWVSVIALTPDEKVILIKQYRHGIRRIILELPGGAVDRTDASTIDAIRRELKEETGYQADRFVELATISANPVNHTNEIHCFLAFNARLSSDPTPESSEQIEVLEMPFDELIERAYGGELKHPHHVAALFFALKALEKHRI